MNTSTEPVTPHKITGYTLVETIYQGPRTTVYRSVETATQQSVVIKVLSQEYPSFSELVQFRNQYAVTQNLSIPGIIPHLSLKPWGNGYGLVMEDFQGIDLGQYAAQHPLSLPEILDIAIQLADILHDLHQHQVIHKDIKPANILIHPDSKQVKLIDFSIASLLPKETQAIQSPKSLEGTLAYLAPEQSGRMNRAIDYRADFYSLGITLYQLLTGQLPFTSHDPLELIHCHMAQLPAPVHQVNPQVPAIGAAIVAKLMAKNAEDRYQTALGLRHDLHQCQRQWQEQGTMANFALGQRDLSDRFNIPEKLYGRKKEVRILLDTFEQVAQGNAELMLVTGFSGMGKTAVVNEVHRPITRQNGYFIKGKFEQLNRNIPFSAFVQAFQDLVRQLLSENDAELNNWRDQILGALGENAQVIVELIPELECIIGVQPSAPELSGTAAQNRFNRLFRHLIQVFTTAEHPLVIFMDDLQWADSASLKLIQVLMTEAQTGYLLLLGAYRDHEVSCTHPLILTLDELENQGIGLKTIALQPLDQGSLNHLIADTLHAPPAVVQPLTKLVLQKTQGNPFFATQFLKTLHQEQLITFDHDIGHWQCDITQIQATALTDDVVALMAHQLQKLPESTQRVLKLAACMGSQFDLETLGIISEQSLTDVAADLWPSLQAGFILPTSQIYKFFQGSKPADSPDINPTYRFLHDRVQQAAYGMIPASKKPGNHLKIGQRLLTQRLEKQYNGDIFNIVNNCNKGTELIDDVHQRQQLAILNLEAGKSAKLSLAYAEAVSYFEQGIRLLLPQGWSCQYSSLVELYSELVEAHFLRGEFEAVETAGAMALGHIQNTADALPIYIAQISSNLAQGNMDTGGELGFKVLNSLGVQIPTEVNQREVQQKQHQTLTEFKTKTIQEFIALPKNHDPHFLRIQDLLTVMVGYAYKARPELLASIISEQVSLLMRHGNIPASASIYALYGMLLCGCQDFESGYFAGEVALAIMQAFPCKQFEMRVRNLIYSYIKPWKELLKNSINPIKQGFTLGLETGDIEYTAYGINHYGQFLYFSGVHLATVDHEIGTYKKILHDYRQTSMLQGMQIFHQTVLNLVHGSDTPWQLEGEVFQESKSVSDWQVNHLDFFLASLYINKLVLSVLFNNPAIGLDYAGIAHGSYHGLTGEFQLSYFHCYRALAHLASLKSFTSERPTDELTQVAMDLAKLEQFASLAPMNFQHQVELVKAERHRVLGQRLEAIDTYDRAINLAKSHGYAQEEALANELAAKFYLGWGKETFAAVYMQAAYYCYSRWGAKAKVADLETRYSQLLRPILQPPAASGDVLTTLMSLTKSLPQVYSSTHHRPGSTSLNQTFDFASILKAAQALSSTIQLDELLRQLTHLILQNSGGDRCALILPDKKDEWHVRSIATAGETQLSTEPLQGNPNLPVKLIQYVKNTQDIVVIDDLDIDLAVIDRYLEQQQPRSVLCLPIITRNRCIGVISIENSLTSKVFTNERVLVLNFLCTQAAISLENSRLYESVSLQSSIIRSSSDGMAILEDNKFIYLNEAHVSLFGYELHELMGQSWEKLYSPMEIQRIKTTAFPVLDQSGQWSGDAKGLHKDGSTFAEEISLQRLDNGKLICICRDISDRKAAENSLRVSESKLRTLLSNLDGVVYRCQNDKTWTMEFMSEAITTLSGYPVSDFINNQERTYASIIHPDDRALVDQTVAQGLEYRQPFTMEYRIIHQDGLVRWVTENGKGIFDDAGHLQCLEGVIVDISDRKIAEAALAESETYHRKLFEQSSIGLLLCRMNGELIYANQAYADILGRKNEELPALTYWDITPQKYAEAEQAQLKSLEQHGAYGPYEKEYIHKNGSLIPVRLSGVIVERDNEQLIWSSIEDISDRKAAEQKLLESETFLKTVLDTFPLSIFWKDRESRYIGVNQNFAQDAGFEKAEDIAGLTDFDMPWAGTEAKDYRADDQKVIASNAPKLGIVETQIQADGTQVWIETNKLPLHDLDGNVIGVMGTYQDISKRKQAEVNSRLLASVVESSDDAIITKNLDGIITSWNQAAVNLFGYTEKEALGQAITMLFPADRLQEEAQIIACIKNKEQIHHFETIRCHKDGSVIDISVTISPLVDSHGNVVGASKIVRDIRDRKRTEAQIHQKNHELEIALTQLQQSQLQLVNSEKMSALGGLVAGIAHEINNPIGCIVGNMAATEEYFSDLLGLLDLYAQQLPNPGPDIENELEAVDLAYVRDDLPQLMRAMKDSGERIVNISRSLRTFSRSDTETQQVFDLHEGLESTVLILRHRLKANEQRPLIEVVKTYGDIPEIACFPAQLNQVFMNILANAIDMFDEIAQSITFEDLARNPQKITVTTAHLAEQNTVEIRIADNGTGILEEIQSRIFDHLFTTKEVGKGTGLGLAIAHQIIVDTHGGSLKVESEMGQGTEFQIQLPIKGP